MIKYPLFRYFTFFILLSLFHFADAQDLKDLMYDPSVNFYEVVNEAEKRFATKETKEGSGKKGFERWRNDNEPKYYPSGDRSELDPYFAEHQFELFQNPQTEGVTSLSNVWRDLGPYQVGDIRGGYSPGLGRVECFYINPADTNQIYLGSRSGGFWKTTNGGQTWQSSTTDTLVASGVNTMSVSPFDPDSVIINVRNASNGTSHGLYRSIDGGNSWTITPFNPTSLGKGGLGSNFQVYKVKYHPLLHNRVYVGTSTGLYISEDNLQTFTQIFTSAAITDIAFHPTDTSKVYVYDNRSGGTNENKILSSSDGGYTFTASATLASNNRRTLHLSISDACPNCVYAASDSGIYVSTDLGLNFSRRGNPPRTCDGFAVSDQDTTQMIYGMLDIYRSADGGHTFTKATQWNLSQTNTFGGDTYVHADLREAASFNGTFYAATDGFLVKTFDYGLTWQILSEGTGIRENYMVGLSQSDNDISLCGSQDNGTSLLNGNGWLEYYGADGMEGIVHPLNPELMIGSFQYGGRIQSDDGGLSIDVTLRTPNASWEAPLLFDPNDQMVAYSFGTDIYKSEDFGLTWNLVGSPTFGGSIARAAIAHNNSQIMVVTNNNLLQLSLNGGQSFTYINAGLPSNFITDVAFAPHDDNIIVVTYSTYQNNGDKIYMTTNRGSVWQNITGNLGDMPLRAVVIDHTDDPHIYVGAEIGVFAKPLNSGSWQLFNNDLPNCSVRDLEIMWGSNTLRAATWGRGLWEADLINHQNHPKITKVVLRDAPTPITPRATVDQPVFADISYTGTLSQVYLRWGSSAQTLDSTINMTFISGQWESDRPLPGLHEDSIMFFKVYAIGSQSDTTETYTYMYQARKKEYCAAAGSAGTGSDWISEVTLTNITNPSNKSSYSDFTNLYANLDYSRTYALEVQLNTSFSLDSVYAWIDYDQNYDFSDAELIRFMPIDANHKASAVFTTPSSVGTDTLRLRVRNQYGNSGPMPCGNVAGEVEDYSIILKGAPIGLYEIDQERVTPHFYPNPSEGKLFAQIPLIMGNVKVELVDVQGAHIQSWSLRSGEQALDLPQLASGLYVLQWSYDGQQGQVKLILK